jgi:bifunctional non-homologous end joining protein LigD
MAKLPAKPRSKSSPKPAAKPLAAYNAKRDFRQTAEPEGRIAAGEGFSFVVQKHAASRLHYDLRLELDGVLKSWAVAKGPSLVPGEKRLAVEVEDHPLDYGGFEGTIPKGQYGGGTVMLWDRGRWEPQADPRKGLAKGHLDFTLHGEKLNGAWHLVRMKKPPGDRNPQWLLIKSGDEAARPPDAPDILEEAPLSVKSGRTMEAIAANAAGAVWDSKHGLVAEERTKAPARQPGRRAARTRKSAPEDPNEPEPEPAARAADLRKRGRKAAMPDDLEPCLATLVEQVPRGRDWVHEIKWDGYRLLAFRKGGRVRLATRRGLDWTDRFPAIAKALAGLPVESAILDGEAVVEDTSGISSFSALQKALSDTQDKIAHQAVFYAFDLLYLDGFDLRGLRLDERKARLTALLHERGGFLRLSEHIEADGEAMIRSACQLGLEGVISKRRDRPYRSGRSDDWRKTKCTDRQEFIILGWTPSTAARRAIGSLVLGYRDKTGLRHAGRTGTGFTAESSRELFKRLEPMRIARPDLVDKPTALQRRDVVWVKPELVAEIEFRGWTSDGHLRHAAFKGLREDKPAEEVVRERPAGPSQPARATVKSSAGAEVAGVALTHPDRVLWPDRGVTKVYLAEFYEEIAGWVLPHVVERPLSLVRCPNGWQDGCFFQKHSWAGLDDVILRDTVRDEGGEDEVLFIRDLRGLVALVQAGVMEIHPWGSRIGDVDRPDRITIDLDPGEGVPWPAVIEAAREVRQRLLALSLESFVKTTGGKGLHVVVPLAPRDDWATAKAFARALAEAMEKDSPSRYVSKSVKAAREGRIYVDYLRNGRGATAVAAYSSRARAGASVSVPLDWDELTPAIKPDHFTVENLPGRLDRLTTDPWAAIGRLDQTLPAAVRKKPGRRPR